MNSKQRLVVGAVVVVLAAGGGYAGWSVYTDRQAYADQQRRAAEDYRYRGKYQRDNNRPTSDDTLGAWRKHFGK
jgi:predicted negative regulator of RcsB-dependent stress response